MGRWSPSARRVAVLMVTAAVLAGCSTAPAPPHAIAIVSPRSLPPLPANAVNLDSQPSPPAEPLGLAVLHMVSVEVGWAVDSGSQRRVLRTVDGGSTWRVAGPGVPVAAFADIDARRAWAFGEAPPMPNVSGSGGSSFGQSQVYRTDDGGGTWRTLGSVPGGGFSMNPWFVDSLHGYVAEPYQPASQDTWQPLSVYATVDGGLHWQLASRSGAIYGHPGAGDTAGAMPGPCGKSLFAYPTARRLLVSGYCPDRVFLQASDDSGRTWRAVSLPSTGDSGAVCTFECDLLGLQFVDAPHGYLWGRYSAPVATWVMYATLDGGRTWVHRAAPPGVWPGVLGFIDSSDAVAWAGDATHTLYWTNDGARSWHAAGSMAPPGWSPGSPPTLEFVTRSVVFDYAPGVLARSDDGGHTWRNLGITVVA